MMTDFQKELTTIFLHTIATYDEATRLLYHAISIEEAQTKLNNLLSDVIGGLKPDTYLLGCEKHWSDDYKAKCTCDENERTAVQFYKKAQDDAINQLGLTGGSK